MRRVFENRFSCRDLWRLGSALAIVMLLLDAGIRSASLFPVVAANSAESEASLSREAATAASSKFRLIEQAYDSGESFGALRLTEQEVNSYFEYELAPSIPAGVSNLRLQFEPGRPAGSAVIDFDTLKEGLRTPPHPIADFLLRGVHTLGVEGTFSGVNGVGEFQLEKVTLDGYTLPRPVVEYLIEHYLRPRYPAAAISRPFVLPYSIDQATVEAGSVLLQGKAARL